MVDPDLQMLKISEEEYKEPYVSERCIKEIGFFNPELVRLERKYHDKFVPEMKISDWEK